MITFQYVEPAVSLWLIGCACDVEFSIMWGIMCDFMWIIIELHSELTYLHISYEKSTLHVTCLHLTIFGYKYYPYFMMKIKDDKTSFYNGLENNKKGSSRIAISCGCINFSLSNL